jgi:hypothetical protein
MIDVQKCHLPYVFGLQLPLARNSTVAGPVGVQLNIQCTSQAGIYPFVANR